MKHLVISEYGSFVGVRNGLLSVRNADRQEKHYPLNRLSTLSIARRGISFSSDLIEVFSARGIKLFFLDFKGTSQAVLIGNNRHGVAAARLHQYRYCDGDRLPLARTIITAKIKNQRAVLNYLSKYHKNPELLNASEGLKECILKAGNCPTPEALLGLEGSSARSYFEALNKAGLFSSSFRCREGRGSQEINNSMLNLGYAVLSSTILGAVENAGLEPYLGILHAVRPGKMSLVLDIMEEYRAWVVDRAVIKLRSQSEGAGSLTPRLKQTLIQEIQRTCSKKYPYRKKQVKLEHIIQRQVYRLSGHFCGDKKYRPYLFKW